MTQGHCVPEGVRSGQSGLLVWTAVVMLAVTLSGTTLQADSIHQGPKSENRVAAVDNLVFGAPYAALSSIDHTTTEQYTGVGSWHETYPSGKTELYIDPVTQFGLPSSFTIGQIQSITYHTLNDGTNPSYVDFYLLIYTAPYVGGDASWYGNRLNAEPLYSNNFVPPSAGNWNTWTTDAGTNQLTFFDSNHCGNFGFYGGPTLQNITSGSITWSTYPGAGAGADPTPIDYASQTVLYLNISTGSGWSTFDGYLDAITITLTTGDSYVIDLESTTDPVYVDDDWAGSAPGVEVEPGKWFGFNAFDKVQDGVDNVCCSTVHVAAGTYVEQVIVDGQDVTIQGAGRALTFIESPATLATTFTTSYSYKPVITATNAGDVQIRDLTVDGLGLGNANNRFLGIAYWNAGGAVVDCDIVRIIDTPLQGTQHGVGVYCANNTGGPYSLEVGGCAISDYQKNAMALTGTGMTVDVHDCTTTGSGPTTVIAQNGIQISSGAGGSIANCTVSDMDYTPDNWVSSGLIILAAADVDVSGTSMTDVQEPVYWQDTNGSITDLEVVGGADPYDAVFAYNTSTSKAGFGETTALPRRLASAFEHVDPGKAGSTTAPGTAASMSLDISYSCFTGDGVSTTNDAIFAWSDGGPLSMSVTHSTITDYGIGMVAYGPSVLTANDNSISGNQTSGFDNSYATNPQDAERNWWGAADGPSGDGSGSGDAVVSVSGEVDFAPWRIDGTDASTDCGFQAGSNVVTPNPPSICISTINPCVTVPIEIARTDNGDIRGYSVTFSLSPELELCSGLTSITEGTYLSSVSGTQFLVVDNGGSSYTVDAAILGLPCGATATTGTLFDVAVKNSGGDGTGTITITDVIARDCLNAQVPADPGAPASLTIDNTLPTAIGDLSATQVKTGNDADGTTKITLAWSAVESGATVEVYRKGFGFYPEYDDAGGAAPSVPTDPVDALANGWAVATGVTTSGDTDEVTTRDFYYFVAFVTDACGNVSVASNRTDGTLNYHLGDVTNGVSPGQGDNLVNTADMSLLGANYGKPLIFNDSVNYLDVGPTTDYFVNALPTTDNQVQFEDLMMFAINFGQVSKQYETPAPAAVDELLVEVPLHVERGSILAVPVWMSGAGVIQGLSATLKWDAGVVEPLGSVETGELLAGQGGLALSAKPGVLDVALLGRRAQGLSGEGTLASVIFRVIQSGDPAIEIASVSARDAGNQPVELGVSVRPGEVSQSAPRMTALLANVPNPFNPTTRLAFTLAEAGDVELAIYDVSGRRIRTLVRGDLEAGRYEQVWDGRTDSGSQVSSGIYYMRLTTPHRSFSRPITLLK